LIKQDTGNLFTYEVVVVHTASLGTREMIEEMAKASPVPVRGIRHPHEGTVSARNQGFREAQGDWIAMFDDDQIAEPQWLRELWLVAKENNVKSVGGLLHLRLPEGCDRKLSQRCRRMLGETVKWETSRPYTRQEGPGSGNQMIHRTVIDQVGIFDHSFVLRGHDTDLYRRIRMAGFDSWYSPKAVGYHIIPPHRLEDSFFKDASLHNGWSFARRDLLERGRLAAVGLASLRAIQALVINLPRLGVSILRGNRQERGNGEERRNVKERGNREEILDARIRLWRAEGYVRSTLYSLAPSLFTQNRFFKKYEFRGEKHFPAIRGA